MNTSFYNGVSGTKTHQFGIDVWSNNIANINLDGFKNSNPEFSSIFSTTLSDAYFNPTSNDMSLGSKPQTTSLDLKQGSLKVTDNTFDLALNSEGWFGLKAPDNQIFYTRTGAYKIDKNGDLVNSDGLYLLGTSGDNITSSSTPQNIIDEYGKLYTNDGLTEATVYSVQDIDDITLGSIDSQTKITLPQDLYYPAVATTNVKIKANFEPQTDKDINGNEIPNTEHISSSIISSNGDKKILDMIFTKRVDQENQENIWDGKIQLLSYYEKYDTTKKYDTTLYKVDTTSNKVYAIEDEESAKVEFSTDGSLLSSNIPTITDGDTTITIDVGENNTYDGFTSISDSSTLKNIDTNGLESGWLNRYSISTNGSIIAEFSNGKSTPVAKIAVYHFQNDQGLDKASATLLTQSSNSGQAFFYKDKNGNDIDSTSVFSNRLEASNTDMATALTELILMQKAFDANAKSITTSDQMIQNAINMKK